VGIHFIFICLIRVSDKTVIKEKKVI